MKLLRYYSILIVKYPYLNIIGVLVIVSLSIYILVISKIPLPNFRNPTKVTIIKRNKYIKNIKLLYIFYLFFIL